MRGQPSDPAATAALPSRSGVGFGLLLGVFGGAWNAIVAFACVPWYIHLLGIESYGLIGFFVTLQAVIGLLDLGVGATINREVARSVALGDPDHARRLLRSLEIVYAVVAIAIAATIALAAPAIAGVWLKPGTLDHREVDGAVRLMGLVTALRWPVGLYYGTLIGLHRPQISYRIVAVMTTVANIGAVLVLSAVHRTIWAYFVWQAVSSLVGLAWVRRSAWRQLGDPAGTGFDRVLLKTVLIQSAMMSGVAMTGVVLTQVDKFVVSASIPLADFGSYSLAAVLAGGLSVLLIPTFNVIYPRLSGLVAADRAAEQIAFYRLGTRLFLGCLFPVALSAFFYSGDFLALWTGNAGLAAATAPIAGLLCLGSALNGVMIFPYALHLARGETRRLLMIGCVLVAVMIPLTLALVREYGALGGALSWLSLNAINLVLLVAVTHVYILPGVQKQWLLLDVAPALGVAALLVGAGHRVAAGTGSGPVERLAIGGLFAVAAMLVAIASHHDTRVLAGDAWQAARARLRSVQRRCAAR